MGINIATLVVLAALIMVLTLMTRVSIIANTALGITMNGASDRAGDRARTGLSIKSTTGGGSNLTVQVKNTGITSVFDYDHVDFIVDYVDANGTPVITRLTYTEGALGDFGWKRTSSSAAILRVRPVLLQHPGRNCASRNKRLGRCRRVRLC